MSALKGMVWTIDDIVDCCMACRLFRLPALKGISTQAQGKYQMKPYCTVISPSEHTINARDTNASLTNVTMSIDVPDKLLVGVKTSLDVGFEVRRR